MYTVNIRGRAISVSLAMRKQRTIGPINAHLTPGPGIN